MPNPFAQHNQGLAAPSGRIRPITKNDSADLPDGVCRGLLVGTAGTANLVDASGQSLTDVPLPAGIVPVGVARVLTGGTADDLWALY